VFSVEFIFIREAGCSCDRRSDKLLFRARGIYRFLVRSSKTRRVLTQVLRGGVRCEGEPRHGGDVTREGVTSRTGG